VNRNKGRMLKTPPASEERNGNKGGMPKDSAAMPTAIKVMAGVLLLGGLALAGLFVVGSMQQQAAQDQADQALQEQQQANEDLQKQLEDMQAKQDAQEKADLQKQIDELKGQQQNAQEKADLQKQIDELKEQQQKQVEQQQPATSGTDVVVVAPADAPEGVIAVAPSFDTTALAAQEESALAAAQAYYAAVEVGDYNATYSMLSSADQANYSLDEWLYANQQLDSAAAEFVVTGVALADTDWYYVYVDIYAPDGTVSSRTTEFRLEDGRWVHWLTAEEMDMFDQALSY
jgi:hypothetical protein